MKNFIIVLLVLVVLGLGGYIAMQKFAPAEMEKVISEVTTKLGIAGKTVPELNEESITKESEKNDGVTDPDSALPSSTPLDKTKEEKIVEFCEGYGGKISEVDKGGGPITTCFINDGKDGILCNAELFYKGECGESFLKEQVEVILNSNRDSNIAMIIKAPSGEGAVAFTKVEDGTEYIDQIVIKTADKKIGLIKVNKDGLPTSFEAEGDTFTFSNYTEDTVDITLTKKDGGTETFEKTSIKAPNGGTAFSDLIFSTTYAAESVKSIKGATRKENEKYYPHTIGQVLNVITCGIGGVTVFLGGSGTPLLLACGQLGLRGVTSVTEMGPCKGDIIQCATEMLIEGKALPYLMDKYDETVEYFTTGVTVKGNIKNRVTGTEVPGVIFLTAYKAPAKTFEAGHVDKEGNFEFEIKDTKRSYTLKIINVGYKDALIDIVFSGNRIRTGGENLEKSVDMVVKEEDKGDTVIEIPVLMDPDGFIKGEVIDMDTGDPIEAVQVGEEGGDSMKTNEEGKYWFKTASADEGRTVMVYAKDGSCNKVIKGVYLTYDLADYISDQYQIFGDAGYSPLVEGSKGDYDLIFKMKPAGLAFAGKLINKASKKGIAGAKLKMDGFMAGDMGTITTDAAGNFSKALTVNEAMESEYGDVIDVEVIADGYWDQSFSFRVKADDENPGKFMILTNNDKDFDCNIKMDPFYGHWDGRADASIAEIGDDVECGGADLSLNVEQGVIKGVAKADLDYQLVVNGDVSDAGKVEGGMAKGGENVTTFDVQLMSNGRGTGKWKDSLGCYGTINLSYESPPSLN